MNYLFDFDGTILDNEIHHYRSYKNVFLEFSSFHLSYEDYCKYFHYTIDTRVNYINSIIGEENEHNFHKRKIELYKELILENPPEPIKGIITLFESIKQNDGKIYVVTSSPKNRIDIIRHLYPFLDLVDSWIYKEDVNERKPSSECWIKALKDFKIEGNCIFFEDSYVGYLSLRDISGRKIMITNKSYFYYDKLIGIEKIKNYKSFKDIPKERKKYLAKRKIDKYMDSIEKYRENISNIVDLIIPVLNEEDKNIFIVGIGKSRHVCNKCTSTWRSYGIRASSIIVEDLYHGDFGIFKNGDIIVYISNSGNTKELINMSKYVKNNFGLLQIELSGCSGGKLKDNVDMSLSISDTKIDECDNINMAPTISSVLFMMLMDIIGSTMAEEKMITKEKFVINHPGGSIGTQLFTSYLLDDVVICAAGNNTRMKPLTNNIPKLLINLDNENVLTKIVNYWKEYTNSFTVITQQKHMTRLEFYLKELHMDFKIKTIEIEDQENAYTIKKSLGNEYDGKRIVITWSDIYPTQKIEKNILTDKNVIFISGNKCRYNATNDGRLFKSDSGNVIGLYYFHNFREIEFYSDKEDICNNYSKNWGNFIVQNIEHIDIGDMDKFKYYIEHMSSMFNTKFFNRITYQEDKLKKESLDNRGDKSIQNEMNWYKNIKIKNIPKIYEYGDIYYIMEDLTRFPTFYDKFSDIEEKDLLKVLESVNILHHSEEEYIIDEETRINDIYIETEKKLRSRIGDIEKIIQTFGPILNVNSVEITKSKEYIISSISEILKDYFSEKKNYHIIHGDCTFSNIIYGDDIYFIDPRGIFGDTSLYGHTEYDYSKIGYSLTGYDAFSKDKYFSFELIDGKLTFHIENILDNFIHVLEEHIPKRILYSLIILHWLSTSYFFRGNISKVLCSHYYGIYLYHKYFL